MFRIKMRKDSLICDSILNFSKAVVMFIGRAVIHVPCPRTEAFPEPRPVL